MASWKARVTNENADLARQLEETEAQISQMSRAKGTMNSQIDEAKRTADEESRERQSLAAQCKNLQHELEQMRDQIDIEQEGKNEVCYFVILHYLF
jgi:myosin heavy chain 6/7